MSDDRTHATAPPPTAPDGDAGTPEAVSTQLRTVALCDLVDSTALVERLGDRRAAELFRRHDRVARDLLHRHQGREIDKTDGFLALFERPIQAVAFALDYQRALRDLAMEEKVELAARVGVHVGDVLLWENDAEDVAKGAKPTEVEGLAKPLAARLMHLARPAQILLSGVAHNLAQRAQDELGPLAEKVRWPVHGRYRFKGLPSPLLVYEVGEVGIAPLQPPPSSSKAQREVPLWRQPRAMALEAVLAIAAVLAFAFAFVGRPQPAVAFGERDWVVLGDLRNLSGDPTVEDALQTAFRISLEQSRFVNVMPDLALRSALERMQEPMDVPVDRAVGSEIAVREGARALILPTVADIGGRIRVSAEIVDPHTQTTLYAESADGVGLESSLASMDLVAARLRLSLGETLQAIERDSAPLPQVTSADLDALKAYAAGEQAMFGGEMDRARALFAKALEIDPGFALAHVGGARVAYSEGSVEDARAHLRAAVAAKERLTARDKLYVEAWDTTLERPDQGLERWRLLGSLYPDYRAGQFNAALIGWQYANLYEGGIPFAEAVLEGDARTRATAHYLLGILKTGANRQAAALDDFEEARKLGLAGEGLVMLGAYLSRDDVAAARRMLQQMAAAGGERSNLEVARVAFGTATGDFAGVRRTLAEAVAPPPPPWPEVLRAHDAQLAWAGGASDAGIAAGTVMDHALRQLGSGQGDAVKHCTLALVAAHVGLMLDLQDAPSRALAACGQVVASSGHALAVQLHGAVAAQHAAATGSDPGAALEAMGDVTPHSPVLVHAVRMQLAAAAARWDVAGAEAHWLVENRGRAHAEFLYQWIGLPAAVVWSRAAPLWQAEALLAANDAQAASRVIDDAVRASPWLGDPGPFAARLASLRERARLLQDVRDE